MPGTLIGEVIGGKSYTGRYQNSRRTRSFKIRSNNKADDFEDIVSACGVLPGDLHPKNVNFRAHEFSAVQDQATWWLWIVTVTYTIDAELSESPLDRDWDVSVDFQSLAEARVNPAFPGAEIADPPPGPDSDGNVAGGPDFRNSAGEIFDPPIVEDIELIVIRSSKAILPTISVEQYRGYHNKSNDGDWTFGDMVIGDGRAKIRVSIGPVETWYGTDGQQEVDYRMLEFEVQIRDQPRGWDTNSVDHGTYYLNGSGDKVPFTDDGEEIGLLDGVGQKLMSSDAVKYMIWKRPRIDFSAVPMPQDPGTT